MNPLLPSLVDVFWPLIQLKIPTTFDTAGYGLLLVTGFQDASPPLPLLAGSPSQALVAPLPLLPHMLWFPMAPPRASSLFFPRHELLPKS